MSTSFMNVLSKVIASQCTVHSYEGGTKVELTFLIIVLFLSLLSCGFSIYSLYHPRYTYKRVTGALHLLTASMLLVIIELGMN